MTVGFPDLRQKPSEQLPVGLGSSLLAFCRAKAVKRGLIFILALALLGCDVEPLRQRVIVATVNGQAITEGDFKEVLEGRKTAVAEELLAKPEVLKALKKRVLEELITRRLFLQEAARLGVSASPEDVERRLAELSQGYTPDEYKAMLAEQGLSLDSFRAKVAEDLTVKLLLEEALGEPEPPKPEAVKAYYREHVEQLHRPVRVRALHLMVATAEEAGRLREAILRGADFAEMARRHSLGPEAAQDGELGWRSPGQMPEAFDEAIFALKLGEVSPVVSSPYGFHLFKLLAVKEAGVPTLEEARPAIVARLEAQEREAQYGRWLDALRAKADIVIHRAVEEVSQ